MFDGILFWPFVAVFGALALLLGVVIFVFWVWMLVDCAQRKFKSMPEKIIWVLIIVLCTWIGSLVYAILIKSMYHKGILAGKR